MATLPNEPQMHNGVPIANRLPLCGLFSATTVSGIGSVLSAIALPWFVLEVTGSAGQAGLTGAAATLPIILAGIFGGTLVDRIGYRLASVVSDLASGVTTAMIPLLYLTVGLEFWQLLTLVFLGNLLDAPGVTARRAIIPELAEHGGMPLARCNGIFEAMNRAPLLVGPLLAGLLIVVMDASMVLWIDAATFGISALLIALAIPARLVPEADAEAGEPRASYFSDMLSGFRWLWRDSVLLSLIIAILLTNLIEAPILIMVTVYAREVLDSSVALGIMIAGLGAGQVIGALLSDRIERILTRRWIFPTGFFAFAVVLSVFLFTTPLALIAALMFCVGILSGPMNPMLNTIFQERVPSGMRGRVFGLRSAMMMAAFPLGVAVGGGVIDAFGLRTLVASQMVGLFAVIAWLATSPRFRQLDPPEAPAGATTSSTAPSPARLAQVDAEPSASAARD